MSGPTPGPWKVVDTGFAVYLRGPAPSDVVCELGGCGVEDRNVLAAALDTLSALKELVEYREQRAKSHPHYAQANSGRDGRYDRARAAIARAEGRQP